LKLPATQHAVQLVGPDELVLNKSKKLLQPGPYQILCKVEAAGLCFSDLKLVKQFSSHPRKKRILSGIDAQVLEQIPSYVPGDAATVPGHEAVVRVCAVGDKVTQVKVGGRYLVETDYRWLPTVGSNGSFGYNFEGALQEYVLMDQRVITLPEGELFLLEASEGLSASAVALVEPWACVEDAYACIQRKSVKPGGRMLIAADTGVTTSVLRDFLNKFGKPVELAWLSDSPIPQGLGVRVDRATALSELADTSFDDIVYFGSNPALVESLFSRLAAGGLLNIVLCGRRFGRAVRVPVGRVHYGYIRMVGTTGGDPAESMKTIPQSGEIHSGWKVNVVGAAGPMGMMHVIRNICQGISPLSIYAGDIDENRLAVLNEIASPLAWERKVEYHCYNPAKKKPDVAFDCTVIMVPRPELAAQAIGAANNKGIINIFAGIPADVSAQIDLDRYIERQLYFVGTSGSVLEDMKRVLAKAESGTLDTNVSVAAVCGLDGVVDGIRAIENRSVTGKIVVYPACKGLGLTPLTEMNRLMPSVAKCLRGRTWCKEAEQALLAEYGE